MTLQKQQMGSMSGLTGTVRVTVLVNTYNHVHFIRQALESVLAQRTTFPYEIIVTDDFSTDGTRQVVQEYHERNPGLFCPVLPERNLGANRIIRHGLEAARGTYIAFLDGDDYWTCDTKLQQQVDFLDRHPACSMCFHNVRVVADGSSDAERLWNREDQRPFSGLRNIWAGNFITWCSAMYRRRVLTPIPEWYDDMPFTDWPLHILGARRGLLGYINPVMAIYRQHPGGAFSPLSEAEKLRRTYRFYRQMNANLDYTYDTLARTAMSRFFFGRAEEYRRRGELELASYAYRLAWGGRLGTGYVPWRRVVEMGVTLVWERARELGSQRSP